MLTRIWGKKEHFSLLVGMKISATAVESNMEVPLKISK
jgi:hypothetical protein